MVEWISRRLLLLLLLLFGWHKREPDWLAVSICSIKLADSDLSVAFMCVVDECHAFAAVLSIVQ